MDKPGMFQISYRYSELGTVNKVTVAGDGDEKVFDEYQKQHPEVEILGVRRLTPVD